MAQILVIDDEPALRAIVRRVFERAGHEVAEASDGSEGCRIILQSSGFDVVITDLVMPRLGGLEVIKMVRQLTPGTRIIAMSGCGWLYGTEDGLALAAANGADLCLHKPFNAHLLLAQMEQLLQARPA